MDTTAERILRKMITLDEETIRNHLIERFLDSRASIRIDGYDHSMTPLGPDEVYTLSLGRDGRFELQIEAYDAYSGIIRDSSFRICGRWVLHDLKETFFTIQMLDIECEIEQGNHLSVAQLQAYYRKNNCASFYAEGVGFSACPEA